MATLLLNSTFLKPHPTTKPNNTLSIPSHLRLASQFCILSLSLMLPHLAAAAAAPPRPLPSVLSSPVIFLPFLLFFRLMGFVCFLICGFMCDLLMQEGFAPSRERGPTGRTTCPSPTTRRGSCSSSICGTSSCGGRPARATSSSGSPLRARGNGIGRAWERQKRQRFTSSATQKSNSANFSHVIMLRHILHTLF